LAKNLISADTSNTEFVKSEMFKNGRLIVGNPWSNADRHIRRLLEALHFIQDSGLKLTKSDESKIFRALAVAMNSCTSAHHPDLSLRLLSHVADSLRANGGPSGRNNNDTENWRDLTLIHDSLTSEIINALGWNNVEDAVDVFMDVLRQEPSNLSHWRSSCSSGLSVLVKSGRGDEAATIFNDALDIATRSPESYIQIGKHLLNTGSTRELGDLYRAALNSGNLSDELTLLTMTTIVKTNPPNRVRVLRMIVDDNAKFFGIDRDAWMRTRYWHAKKALGSLNARLLMWWNDPETWHMDELEFAISDFKARMGEGLKVRNDAVRAIVNHARSFDESKIAPGSFRWKNFVPRTKAEFIVLVLNVVEECQSSPIIRDPFFIDGVVAALRNLEGNQECVAFVTAL